MSSESYAAEKFWGAIDVMATSERSLQERLYYAYMTFHPVQDQDFSDPDDAQLYRKIMNALTAIRNGDESRGYVQNTLDAMNDADARSVANDIFSIFSNLSARSQAS